MTSSQFKALAGPALYSKEIRLEDITDENWTKGVWTNPSRPNVYSFVYRRSQSAVNLKAGDRIRLGKSGERTVVKVENAGDYRNVLLDGQPLGAESVRPSKVVLVERLKAKNRTWIPVHVRTILAR